MRHEETDINGNVSISYSGSLAENKAERIATAKAIATQMIRDAYPDYKRENAALGIRMTSEEAEGIKAGIEAIAQRADEIEAQIIACGTIPQVWAINITF